MDSDMELDIFHLVLKLNLRWNGAVGVATRYWTDCPEIESHWGGGQIFRNLPVRPWGSPCLYIGNRLSFLGVKLVGRVINHPP